MNFEFDLSTTGIETKIGGNSRTAVKRYEGETVVVVKQSPGEESNSRQWKLELSETLVNTLGFDPEAENNYFTIILGDAQANEELHGRVFLAKYGNQFTLNKTVKEGMQETRSNKDVYKAFVDKVEWIDPTQGDVVLSAEVFPNANDIPMVELVAYTEPTEEEERPDVDTAAQEVEEANAMDW